MLTLSSAAILEKNKLDSTGAFLVLLEINFEGVDPIRLVRNTEDIEWNGETWYAFPFDIDDVQEDAKGQLPNVTIRVGNVTRVLQQYLDDSQGGLGATVTIRVVHSDHLDLTDPEFEETFEVIGCSVDQMWVRFTLGAENPLLTRCPRQRFLKDHCRYKEFKGTLCGYSGSATECDRTFERCMELGNEHRFGGFPGIPTGGVYAKTP